MIPLIAGAIAGTAVLLVSKLTDKHVAVIPKDLTKPIGFGIVPTGQVISPESAAIALQMAKDSPNAVINPDPLGDPNGDEVAIIMLARELQNSFGISEEDAKKQARAQLKGT